MSQFTAMASLYGKYILKCGRTVLCKCIAFVVLISCAYEMKPLELKTMENCQNREITDSLI